MRLTYPRASAAPSLALVVSLIVAGCGGSASPAPSIAGASATIGSSTTPPASPGVSGSPAPSVVEPTDVPGGSSTVGCAASSLAAKVTGWEGGTGHRTADVELTNTGASACDLTVLDRPQLVDGKGAILIDGEPATSTATIPLAPAGTVKTTVQAANYCGADPVAPVTVAFVLPNGLGQLVAAPASASDTSGLPPCMGDPGTLGDIEMQPWAP